MRNFKFISILLIATNALLVRSKGMKRILLVDRNYFIRNKIYIK